MSKLFGIGRAASEYVRRRMSRETREADAQIERESTSDYVQSRRTLLQRLSDFVFGRKRRQQDPPGRSSPPTAPPIQQPGGEPPTFQPPRTRPPLAPPVQFPPQPRTSPPEPPRRPPTGTGFDGGDDDAGDGGQPPGGEDYDDIEILGRDASYDEADWRVVMERMRLTPGSTNVYGYYFEFESRTMGILYVTFLNYYRTETRSGPGPTYAYYDVPARKYHQFQNASGTSAGGAVWDYLRIRGTSWGHQHNYRLIQVSGDYIPRKATRRGFRTRNLPALGTGRREYRRSTLPEQVFPNRGRPNRGQPDRGEPDRG